MITEISSFLLIEVKEVEANSSGKSSHTIDELNANNTN